MGSRNMVEWPAALKGLAILVKHPLAVCSVLGSMAGAAVIAAYNGRQWVRIFFTNTAVAIAVTPMVIRLAGQEPTLDTYAGFACGVAMLSHVVIKIVADKRIHNAIVEAATHQIERFSDKDKDK
jgi:hypothetical protein